MIAKISKINRNFRNTPMKNSQKIIQSVGNTRKLDNSPVDLNNINSEKKEIINEKNKLQTKKNTKTERHLFSWWRD